MIDDIDSCDWMKMIGLAIGLYCKTLLPTVSLFNGLGIAICDSSVGAISVPEWLPPSPWQRYHGLTLLAIEEAGRFEEPRFFRSSRAVIAQKPCLSA